MVGILGDFLRDFLATQNLGLGPGKQAHLRLISWNRASESRDFGGRGNDKRDGMGVLAASILATKQAMRPFCGLRLVIWPPRRN